MIPVYTLVLPEYKIGGIDPSRTDTTRHYGLNRIPVTYIENAPDFETAAQRLRDFIRRYCGSGNLCIRGISLSEHNRVNGTAISADTLIDIIVNTGHDRYNPEIAGNRYCNIEKLNIDIFAYDVIPFYDDDDLTYFFQSFYWYGLAENGEPSMLDVIIVYDTNLLDRIEHHYAGRGDIKRDGFAFRNGDKTACIKCIINLCAV
jgi:hypothetical protein